MTRVATIDSPNSGIVVYDEILRPDFQKALLAFLKGPGWSYGAYSDASPNPSLYWYKHFAGVTRDNAEAVDSAGFEGDLKRNAPIVSELWTALKQGLMRGHELTRCYANGYPVGAEAGLHQDAASDTHSTAIYYPHLDWHANYAGETVFFTPEGSDIIRSVYPRPNRLVVFPGTIPHVARPITSRCPHLRITLMFKTVRAASPI